MHAMAHITCFSPRCLVCLLNAGLACLISQLTARCLAEQRFFPKKMLQRLLNTGLVSWAQNPTLLAVVLVPGRAALCDVCLQRVADIPEAAAIRLLSFFHVTLFFLL